MKRLFISIPFPSEWLDAFEEYCSQFLASFANASARRVRDVRWTAKENIHITACFLGDVDEARIGDIKERVAALCERVAPFSLAFEKIAFGPPGHIPRMVWAVFKESDAYAAFVGEMRKELHEFLAVEPHEELIPHATLASLNFVQQNFRGRARLNDPLLARDIDIAKPQPALTSFTVEAVELMESQFDPAGARYEKIETFPLRAHA